MPKQYVWRKGSDEKFIKCFTDASIAQKLLEFNNACTNSDSFDINEYCSNLKILYYPWQINLY